MPLAMSPRPIAEPSNLSGLIATIGNTHTVVVATRTRTVEKQETGKKILIFLRSRSGPESLRKPN